MTKNQSRHVHLLVLVLHHRYSLTIVPDRNGIGLTEGGRIKSKLSYRDKIKNTINRESEIHVCRIVYLTSIPSGKCVLVATETKKSMKF